MGLVARWLACSALCCGVGVSLVGQTIEFRDSSRSAGLNVVTWSGSAEKPHILESTGNGVLVLDYDGDGFQDLLFVAALRLPKSLDEAGAATPFFAWIHLYDPHAPYEPPEPFRPQYPGDPYRGEIAHTDSIVGQIVSELQTRQRLSNTLLAVVGDHGEGLGEHGERTHSLLIYNSTLHVPMMIRAPGTIAPVDRSIAYPSRLPWRTGPVGRGRQLADDDRYGFGIGRSRDAGAVSLQRVGCLSAIEAATGRVH